MSKEDKAINSGMNGLDMFLQGSQPPIESGASQAGLSRKEVESLLSQALKQQSQQFREQLTEITQGQRVSKKSKSRTLLRVKETFYLSEEVSTRLHERWKNQARGKEISKSQMVDTAIRLYLEKER